MAVIAGRIAADGVEGRTLIDLTRAAADGTLHWAAPQGRWRIMRFTWKHAPGRPLVDGASRDAVDWYIKTVYQPHYDRFRADFGKTIAGYFYDEPETPGDWGTEVRKVLDERGVDWKRALVAWKFKLAGEEQTAARYQYQDAFAEAWGRTLYAAFPDGARRAVSCRWALPGARERLSGARPCAGQHDQLIKYSAWADRRGFAVHVVATRRPRSPCWQTPKLGSSVTHAYGKPDDVTMVEIFGARGQDLTYPEMKWWADHMQVSGVNFLIPHSFNPRAPRDTDCPPYFYMGAFEPRFPLYRVWADYTSRLSAMLTGGRHVCPVALLYLGNSAHAGKYVTPEQISEALQDALYDCDWIPYDVFEGAMKVDGTNRACATKPTGLVVPPVDPSPTPRSQGKAFTTRAAWWSARFLPPVRHARQVVEGIAGAAGGLWADRGPLEVQGERRGRRSYLMPQAPTVDVSSACSRRPPAFGLHSKTRRHHRQLAARAPPREGPRRVLRHHQNHEARPAASPSARQHPAYRSLGPVPQRDDIGAHLRDGHIAVTLTMEPNQSVCRCSPQDRQTYAADSRRKPQATRGGPGSAGCPTAGARASAGGDASPRR